MPPYGEPDWASPGDTTNAPPAVQAATTNGAGSRSVDANSNVKCFIVMLSVADVLVAALMAMLGVMELLDFAFDGLSNLSEAFLAAYMVLFAALLAGYEFIWWQPISSFNKVFRKNFGFMYGLKGKGFYLIFIAFLCLGLWDGSPRIKGLDYITGVSWLAVGCLHLFLSCCYPNANDAYHPATAGLVQAGATNTQGTPNDNVV